MTDASIPQIKQILRLLKKRYGERDLIPNCDPLSELIQTILSQNTSDTNSRLAFDTLKSSFENWDSLLDADVNLIAKTIRGGGLAQIKAQRIQQTLIKIKQIRGKLELDFLGNLSVYEAKAWLKQFPGIGNKTANCVLLFALGRPALPVDTHIFRVSARLGLINKNISFDQAHEVLGKIILPNNIYAFHVLMIEHGRKVCVARHPRCRKCALQTVCFSFKNVPGQYT